MGDPAANNMKVPVCFVCKSVSYCPSTTPACCFLKTDENNCLQHYYYYYVRKWHEKKIKVAYSGTQKLENNGIIVALTTFLSPSPAPSFILGNG